MSHRTVLSALIASGCLVAGAAAAQDAPEPSCSPLILEAVAYDDDNVVLPVSHGNVRDRVVDEPRSVADGDFLITAPGRGSSLNGADEAVVWMFNLKGESRDAWLEFDAMDPKPTLTEATLELSFSPQNGAVGSDMLVLPGVPLLGVPVKPWRHTNAFADGDPVDTSTTYDAVIDLLEYHDPVALTDHLSAFPTGRVTAVYHDDSLIEESRLELVFDNCSDTAP